MKNASPEYTGSLVIVILTAVLFALVDIWYIPVIGAALISVPHMLAFTRWRGSDEQKDKEEWNGPGCSIMTLSAVLAALTLGIILIRVIFFDARPDLLPVVLQLLGTFYAGFAGMAVVVVSLDRITR